MNDIFDSHTRSLTSPPENGTAVIPDNSTDLVHVTRAIYVGGGGDLALRLLDGTDLVFANVAAGSLLPIPGGTGCWRRGPRPHGLWGCGKGLPA